jgi:hypothetical protein
MYIDSPKTITFNIPLCYIFGYFHFFPEYDAGSDTIQYECYNPFTGDYVWNNFTRTSYNPYYDCDGYDVPITSTIYFPASDKRKKGYPDSY